MLPLAVTSRIIDIIGVWICGAHSKMTDCIELGVMNLESSVRVGE